MARRRGHIYRDGAEGRELREFEARYGPEHGREVYGAVVGKVAREQAAYRPGGVKVEHIPGHISFSSKGQREWVRGSERYVHAHPHSRDHHGGRCGSECRRAMTGHRHRRGSSRGG